MKNKHIFNISMICMLALSGPAFAKTYSKSSMYEDMSRPTYRDIDRPARYGRVASTSDTFSLLEKRQDNFLNRLEYNNAINTANFLDVDRDGDGLVSRWEYENYNRRGTVAGRTDYSAITPAAGGDYDYYYYYEDNVTNGN